MTRKQIVILGGGTGGTILMTSCLTRSARTKLWAKMMAAMGMTGEPTA
jgi:NADH dehydrogenase FAD-containing subunit